MSALIQPDTTKTTQVDAALIDGETAEKVSVVPWDRDGVRVWLIVVDYGWAQTNVALCDYAHHANGVALALSGCMDCDLVLGDELEAELA